jgi:hypothetical protein
MTNKCTLSADRFDGHGGAPVQFRWHCPMRHVQGYPRSPWALASGDYSLRIAPAFARATGKQTTIDKYTQFAGRFGGHRDVVVRYRVHHPMEEVQGFTRSHWMPKSGKHLLQLHQLDMITPDFLMFFIIKLLKRPQNTRIEPNNNRGMTYQTDEKHLTRYHLTQVDYYHGIVFF